MTTIKLKDLVTRYTQHINKKFTEEMDTAGLWKKKYSYGSECTYIIELDYGSSTYEYAIGIHDNGSIYFLRRRKTND